MGKFTDHVKVTPEERKAMTASHADALVGLFNHVHAAGELLGDCDGDAVIASRILLSILETNSATWTHEYCRGVVALALTELARREVK